MVSYDTFASILAEGMHTAFRKANAYGPEVTKIHQLISEMDSDDWHLVVDFVALSLVDDDGELHVRRGEW